MDIRTFMGVGLTLGALLVGPTADASPRDGDGPRERVVREVRDRDFSGPRRSVDRVAPERVPREVMSRPGPLCARPGGPCE